MRVGFSVLVCAILCASAHASFELALLTTVGSNSITRVDPENRLLLGSFGANRLLNPRAIAARTVGSEAYILNSYASGQSRITVMNYFTGETLREFAVEASPTSFDIELLPNGDVVTVNSSGAARYSSTGSFIRTYSTLFASAVSSSTIYDELYVHRTDGTVQLFNASTGTSGGSITTGLMSGGTASQSLGASYGGDGQVFRRLNHASLNVTSTTFTGMNSILTVGFGHGNTVYAGGYGSAGQSTITTFDSNLNRLSDAWNISGGGSGINSMTVVTAPEPGTLIALGLGAAALLRRRTRR